jgi:glycogen operon protein
LRDVAHEEQRVSLSKMIATAKQAWHGLKPNDPDWSENSHSVAFGAELRSENLSFHLILNAYWEPLEFELPLSSPEKGPWRRWIDTSLLPPEDIVEWQDAPRISGNSYRAGQRSVVMLYAMLS